MMQMRWLVTTAFDGQIIRRALQYRQLYDATIRAQSSNMINWPHEPAPNMQWSEWIDVPEVSE